MEFHELIILGAGPAGLTAAVYARRAGLEVLIVDRGMFGGQITNTDEVDNWPGTVSIAGFDLGQQMYKHAQHFGTKFLMTEINSLRTAPDGKIIVDTGKGELLAGAVIIGTGATFRSLGCKGEAQYVGKGVSYCAICDAAFYRDQEIVVVGGGNTAVEEALFLTKFVSKVSLVHRRNELRADRIAIKRLLENPKVVPVWDSVVEEIKGSPFGVEAVEVKNVKTGAVSRIPATGVFIFVGIQPNIEFIGNLVEKTESGWIMVKNEQMETSIPGIFAAGDVRETGLRQIVTAAADGARAAIAAYHHIEACKCRVEQEK